MQGCDFVMTFYPVGAMVAAGQAANIYPPADATSFIDAPFNIYAHKLLTSLPKEYVAIYMYSPLVAAVFVPFSLMSATVALGLWQVLSVATLFLVSFMLAGKKRKETVDYFFMMALFCPIFHTLLIGHLGIVLGLLPLAAGYYLWTKNRELAAGFVWGFLAFKPQFLPAAMLVAGALLLTRRPKMLAGLALGLGSFVALSVLVLGPTIFSSWLHSLKMADTIFANPAYGFPEYMVVSLPAVLLQSFPHAARAAAKLPIYGLSAAIGLFTLWHAVKLLRLKPDGADALDSNTLARSRALVMTLGLFVLPLVLPHYLFYDMCGMALICAIAYQQCWSPAQAGIMRLLRRLLWWVCNLFYCGFMFLTVKPLGQWYAFILVAFYALLYYRVLRLPAQTESESAAVELRAET